MKTSVDWRSFCSEVAEQWFKNQESIGGSGLEVEIDETLISRRKYQGGRILKAVWRNQKNFSKEICDALDWNEKRWKNSHAFD